ncbi:4-hydroxy-tetrahydrodipicolinate synthase [Lamprobacter modestohalophilus]|uniref:4-hydroxy-tetrahydrodipicolinate synthase n=1 Tax=Lamprobacter modestohalophilus TaxID=1064514 RepID=A0A9X0W6B8_9GAMM|nr:4-hydroxy-tetrahydrodipicolinate synthase [Lamprobacter modestohalophilus]MBK1617629.1 4-hydroxy-tetrahydrodipicolinate synthase [Lamprobacter modestohalophilus]
MIRGSIVALVTPMSVEGEVDGEALKRLVDLHVQSGTAAIVAVGTTGESATLDEAEHCEVLSRTVAAAAGRIPVIAGTGANSTTEAIRLTQCAADTGADAALLVTPYYNKPTQAGLIAHYRCIADAVDIPQILYNVPGRTACDLLPATACELASHPRIIGIKDATGDLTRVAELRAGCGPDFAIYSGDDATGCELMLQGGDGVISVTNNVAPALMAQLCQVALAGERDQALALNARLDPLHRNLFVESNPIPVKWALHEMGLIGTGIRLPLTWLSESQHAVVRQALIDAGVL